MGTLVLGVFTGLNARLSTRAAEAQAEIASRKLNLDLYDRRFAIWRQVRLECKKLIAWSLDTERRVVSSGEVANTFEDFTDSIDELIQTSEFLFNGHVKQAIIRTAKAAEAVAGATLSPKTHGTDAGEQYRRAVVALTLSLKDYLDFENIGMQRELSEFIDNPPE